MLDKRVELSVTACLAGKGLKMIIEGDDKSLAKETKNAASLLPNMGAQAR
jgi:hypothetical protein